MAVTCGLHLRRNRMRRRPTRCDLVLVAVGVVLGCLTWLMLYVTHRAALVAKSYLQATLPSAIHARITESRIMLFWCSIESITKVECRPALLPYPIEPELTAIQWGMTTFATSPDHDIDNNERV